MITFLEWCAAAMFAFATLGTAVWFYLGATRAYQQVFNINRKPPRAWPRFSAPVPAEDICAVMDATRETPWGSPDPHGDWEAWEADVWQDRRTP